MIIEADKEKKTKQINIGTTEPGPRRKFSYTSEDAMTDSETLSQLNIETQICC